MNPAELAPDPAPAGDASAPHPAGEGAPTSGAAVPSQPHHPGVPTDLGDLDVDLTADPPGPLLATGTVADVYALDDRRVLRRDRDGRDASGEAEILRHVVAHGFPAPAVLGVHGPDLVAERLHGPTLLQALTAGEVSIHDGAQILADLHRRLHEIPAPDGWSDTRSQWPHVTGGPTVVHLDLHPANVILSEAHGPALIDWSNARSGPAELDVALTALIIAEVVVDAGGEYSAAARALLAAFLTCVGTDLISALDDAAAVRSQDPSLVAGERELVPAAAALIRELVAVAAPPEH
ncbi:phosphotransferase [Cellulomonas sp. H30R-01]|jgi:aminoglycoside phosphotransferase (APT) family kinase protein|uniref:phosphotransferase n=1 Tax=Cellulomonas sp. H30R-01 TaxID=2704467 RepID=UPI00138CC225|nr:phosphotransferase [Cellulomonas sp. H30R-01]QHT57200.1 phosphotransferase [Cellulomonas sp. H30R-01]